MKTTFKKFTAVFLALIMMLSVFTATTVNAETDETDTNIYFNVSDLKDLTSPEKAQYYCHFESFYGTHNDFSGYTLYADEELCEYNPETGLVSYDVSKLDLSPYATYKILFVAKDNTSTPESIHMSYYLEFGKKCLGNTINLTYRYGFANDTITQYGYNLTWADEELANEYKCDSVLRDTNIYLKFPYWLGITPGLENTEVYCHIYAINDSDPDFVSKSYMSKAEACTYNEKTGTYSYDVVANFAETTPLKDDAEYAVEFTVKSDTDMYVTSPLKLTTSCINDTATIVNDNTLAPSDSVKAVYTAYWSGNKNFENNKPLKLIENDTNIYVEYPDFLFEKYGFAPSSITTYCHIESIDDPDFVPLELKSTDEYCTVIRNDLVSFNVGYAFENTPLKEGKTYTVQIYFDPSGPIGDVVLKPLEMGVECLGDTLYPVDNDDSYLYSDEYKAYWKDKANAEKYQPYVDTKIYYKIPDFYEEKLSAVPGTSAVHCYIYPLNGTDPDFEKLDYLSLETKCEYDEETGLYSFDLAEKFAKTPLKEKALYGVIFTVAPSGPYPNIISADLTMGVDCMGDTAYTVESSDSAPMDSPSGGYATYWTKNSGYCLVKSLGDVNEDGETNIMDATFVQMSVTKLKIDEDLELFMADMNNDKLITITDATLVQMKIAKYI